MSEKTAWRIAWPCFLAAGVLAIANVYLLRAFGTTAWTLWLHIAALWLIFPAACYGLFRLTGYWR